MKPKLIAMLALLLCVLGACGGNSSHQTTAPSHSASPVSQGHALTPLSPTSSTFRMGATLAQVEVALHSKPEVRTYAGGSVIWSTWYYFLRDPADPASGTPLQKALYTVQTDGKGAQSHVIKIVYQPWRDDMVRDKRAMAAHCFALGPVDAHPVPNHEVDRIVGAGEYFNFYSPSLAIEISPDAWRTGNPSDPAQPGTTYLRPTFDISSQKPIGCMWSLGTV